MSDAISQLHPKVLNWIGHQRWTSLREIQEKAIGPILSGKKDVIISAATAAGKTEAAFLPAFSAIADCRDYGVAILYVAPLKALINDQARRLESLCKSVDVPFTPWHGDIAQSTKAKCIDNPSGLILITPESLESIFINHGRWAQIAFANLKYVIIDEFHAFMGTERGRQLQSLLHRLDSFIQKKTPRIALSATLGDLNLVKEALRPNGGFPCECLTSNQSAGAVRLQIRGYESDEKRLDDLFNILRGKSHLAFVNARTKAELISNALKTQCETNFLPNEFFPHHGNLSKTLREWLEKRLVEGKLPTTAVCTMTLELGIDIGHVDSVAQIDPPSSVSSVRQRLGRTGRRGGDAVLRMFVKGKIADESDLVDDQRYHATDYLSLEIFQATAITSLLLQRWCESGNKSTYHFSTLIQQILSVICQYGSVRAEQLWMLLCKTGPFSNVEPSHLELLLRAMLKSELLTKSKENWLTLGVRGEQLVQNYKFYAAFATPEEWRLVNNGEEIGTIPVGIPVSNGQIIIFAGLRWEIERIFEEKRLILLKKSPSKGGIIFVNDGPMVDKRIHQEMYQLYCSDEIPLYLNQNAKSMMISAKKFFHENGLVDMPYYMDRDYSTLYLFTWLGSKGAYALAQLFLHHGLKACVQAGGVLSFYGVSITRCAKAILKILSDEKPADHELALKCHNTMCEKHDWFVPKELRALEYGQRYFDVDEAWQWLEKMSHYFEDFLNQR